MTGKLLLRGMIAGVVAGILAFVFARIYGEPLVDFAINFEEHASMAAGEAAEPELVSRTTQAGLGLLTGLVTYGAALGGILSLVFSVVYGRFSNLPPRTLSACLALAGFAAIVLIPAIKYPANPPAVGNPDTIGIRTALFFIMLAATIACMTAAVALARSLWARLGGWNASIVAAACFAAVISVAMLALPAINEVPEAFSAVVLWRFRVASLGIQAITWTAIGLIFGYLAETALHGVAAGRTKVLRTA